MLEATAQVCIVITALIDLAMPVLLLRQQYHISDGEPLTRWGIVAAQHRGATRALALMSVSIETLFPLALFNRIARWLLVPAALGLLVGIRLLMGPTFEQFMICYVFWVPWAEVAAAIRQRITARARLAVTDRLQPSDWRET